MNFLEQLVAEWYAYSGYFVRTNIKMNKLQKGGWANEIDVLAYSPEKSELIHIESSWDANSWNERKERFTKKKFVYSHEQYEKVASCKIKTVRKIALCGLSKSAKADLNWGDGIEVVFIPTFIAEINRMLGEKSPLNDAVPEGYPRLRAMQFALAFAN